MPGLWTRSAIETGPLADEAESQDSQQIVLKYQLQLTNVSLLLVEPGIPSRHPGVRSDAQKRNSSPPDTTHANWSDRGMNRVQQRIYDSAEHHHRASQDLWKAVGTTDETGATSEFLELLRQS
jgi:hypothetical protein